MCGIAGVAWSPDGTEVAYTVREEEKGSYVLNVETGESRRLTTGEGIGAEFIEWLPDGSGLAIERCYEGCYEAVFAPSSGGEEELLATIMRLSSDFGGFAPDARRYLHSDDVVRVSTLGGSSMALTEADIESNYIGLSWSPDGESVTYVRVPSRLTRRYTVDVETGEVGDLPLLPTSFISKVSPDETLVAFLRDKSQLWLANSDGSNERLLAEIEVLSFEWSPDGERIAYTSFDTNTVHVVDVDDLEDQQLSVPPGHFSISGWSPDGSKLAAVGSGQMIVINVATGKNALLAGDVDLYANLERWPAWSPDGNMLLYLVRDEIDHTHIVVVDVESGQRRQLTDAPQRDHDPVWSPGGESIAFWRQLIPDVRFWEEGLYVVSVESGEERELARFRLRGSSLGNLPAWSPDGERIAAFAQSIEGPGIYVVAVEEAGVTHVIATSDGRGYAGIAWSEDGKEILLESFYQGI